MRIVQQFHEPKKRGRYQGKALVSPVLIILIISTLITCNTSIKIKQSIEIENMPRKKQTKKDTLILTKYNRHKYNFKGEINNEPSQTSQGEAVSMAEMIRRYTSGDIPPLAQAAFYGTDINIDDYEGAKPMEDLTELDNIKDELQAAASRGKNDRSSVGENEAKKTGSVAEGSNSEVQASEEISGEGAEVNKKQ